MTDKSILIIEDDFLNRRLMKKLLTENGYRVFEAKNDREAYTLLNRLHFDLLILDINLGEGKQDGVSFAQKIKDIYHIPFIYVTAYETTDIVKRAIETKPHSYMTKPL